MNGQTGLSYEDLLDAVPLRNEAVQSERKGAAALVLYLPLKERWFHRPPVSWLLPISRRRAFGLDKLGVEVWEACTGHRRTLEIIRQFGRDHGLTFHEARVSVCAFLRTLTERKLVVMIGRDAPGTEVGL